MIKKNIPNIITLLNLFCGCMAIMSAANQDYLSMFYLVLAGMVFDFLDGFAARALGAYSELGKQLDSLSDLVTFGVAPSVMLYTMGLEQVGFMVAIFSAYRLAKFNIDTRQTTTFIGLPTPANALFFISIGYLAVTMPYSIITDFLMNEVVLSAITIISSLLLVCEIPMFSLKFKSYDFGSNKLVYSFLICSLAAIIVFKIVAIPFIIVAYVLISVIKKLMIGRA